MSSFLKGRRLAVCAIACALVLLAATLGALGHLTGQVSAVSNIDSINTVSLFIPSGTMALRADLSEDQNGVPRINATSVRSGYAALGYEHARRNLFQLLELRAFGQGRGTELLGEALLTQDKALRMMGYQAVADAMYARATPNAKQALDAYAQGIDLYLSQTPAAQLSPAVQVLLKQGYAIEKWQPRDGYIVALFLTFTLDFTDLQTKLTRFFIANSVSPAVAAALMPVAPEEPTMFDEQGQLTPLDQYVNAPGFGEQVAANAQMQALGYKLTDPTGLTSALDTLLPFGGGKESNSFVVSGRLTETGKPILENDPHLQLLWPAAFHFAEIKTPAFDLAGAFIVGSPFVFSGHNQHAAWGATFLMASVIDARYGFPVTSSRTEIFRIAGQTTPVTLIMRRTAIGPVLNDGIDGLPPELVFSVQAASLTDQFSIDGFFDLPFANAISQLVAALSKESIGLNYSLASDEGEHGRIAYKAVGLVPQRSIDNLVIPVPADEAHDWTGFASYNDLPFVADPPSGMLATANGRIVPSDYTVNGKPLVIGAGNDDASRTQQMLRELLKASDGGNHKLTLTDLSAIQQSVRTPHEQARAQLLLDALKSSGSTISMTTEGAQAIAALRDWDGSFGVSSQGALYYSIWMAMFTNDAAIKGLDKAAPALYSLYARGQFITGQLAFAEGQLRQPSAPIFSSPAEMKAAVATALSEALHAISLTGAKTWGDIHQVTPNHPFAVVDPSFALAPAPVGGGPLSPSTGGWMMSIGVLASDPLTKDQVMTAFAQDAHADMRAFWVIGGRSIGVSAQGEWGYPSAHYADGFAAYLRGDYWSLN